MYKRHTKKRDIIVRALIYTTMTTAVVIGVIVSLFWAMGYRFDFDSGQISQVSLLQFRSFPNRANVDVNGERLPASTPTRLNVPVGKSTVKMSLDGYRSWQKTVDMSPGEVLWLNYTRLIPTSITTETIRNFTSVQDMQPSPNQRWLMIQNAGAFLLADISDPKNVRFSNITIPADKLTVSSNPQEDKFAIVGWDSSSRYILVSHSIGDKTEFLRLDRQNSAQAVNLSTEFKKDISDMNFIPEKHDEFYGVTDKMLSKFKLKDHPTTETIVSQTIVDYKISSDGKVAFMGIADADLRANPADSPVTVGVYSDHKVTEIKKFNTAPTFINIARFNDQDHLVIAEGETVTIYRDPIGQGTEKSAYLSSPSGIDWLSLSPDGRFVVAGNDGKIVGYDLDVKRNFSFEIDYTNKPTWLDDHHLIITPNGQIQMMDFDGTNRENIVSGHGSAILSEDEKFLFSLDNSGGGVILQRSKLVID